MSLKGRISKSLERPNDNCHEKLESRKGREDSDES
ncbi:hypothetical protein BVRB_5g112830 [Beta vulgaris subsp. vulgaris]|nr:hypothetical protein BVRB_5g112830 [Beta vulgaris subsp. vulgaris]